jgi:carboxyl-terminal processing protease
MTSRNRLLVALVSTAIVTYFIVGSLMGRVLGDSTYSQLALFGEVLQLVKSAYVEPVNLERTMHGAQLGLTEALDGDSAYLDATEFREYVEPSEKNDADVGLAVTRRLGFLMLVAVLPGSPADRAGLRTGDILKTIDGHHTRPLAAATGLRMLRGAPGSVVELAVLRRSNDPIGFALVREKLTPAAPTVKTLADGVALIRVPDFFAGAADGVRAHLESLKRSGTSRVVLDLRGSAFGQYPEAVGLAELFLKGGGIARFAERHAQEQVLNADPRRNVWQGPLAVLIDNGTAGPAEIVAAALSEGGRATLVGRRTFGRVGVQRAVPLGQGGLVLTVGKYLTPAGKPIHEQGIEPAVAVARDEDSDSGAETGHDPILEKALELLKSGDRKAADLGSSAAPAVLGCRAGEKTQASPAVPA